ncbi:hypothetical protein GCM10011289_20660 [Paludibacterium paludis]|uniref:Uncharacterized protein n=1 Tax=Paludibacterium paludis TaxID=1225769 RepID=A0A918UA48_9NEIS|nr:hypothetical protein GCM10011289_20660 [Paludibacterium paludis]
MQTSPDLLSELCHQSAAQERQAWRIKPEKVYSRYAHYYNFARFHTVELLYSMALPLEFCRASVNR